MSTPSSAIDPVQLAHWRTWVGRSEVRRDVITAAPLNAWVATLDRDDSDAQAGTELPPLAHWLYFLPLGRQSEMDADGHVRRGGFLPAITLPRRMWAGGRISFHRALRVGEAVERTSRIAGVDVKSGRSGPLVFATVRHEIADAQGLALVEEQDVVYREAAPTGRATSATASHAAPARSDETFVRRIAPDPVLLFRYSALTFNGHRIHYDHRYVTEVEGYPDLVVHGPLIATLLADLLRRQQPAAHVQRFAFTAKSPLFAGQPFDVCGRFEDGGRRAVLWARNHQGALAMQADVELA